MKGTKTVSSEFKAAEIKNSAEGLRKEGEGIPEQHRNPYNQKTYSNLRVFAPLQETKETQAFAPLRLGVKPKRRIQA